MKTYVTFGQIHRHTIDDVVYDKDCVALIESDTSKRGREIAFELFKGKFCFEYPEKYFNLDMKHFPRGIIEVHNEL